MKFIEVFAENGINIRFEVGTVFGAYKLTN
jgi:hypothetical protein